jgi:F0F1-type ATP synthase assembly protein I
VEEKPPPSLFDLLAMGVTSALLIGGGLGLGLLLDDHLGTGPLFTFVGLGLGIAMAVAATVREVRSHL